MSRFKDAIIGPHFPRHGGGVDRILAAADKVADNARTIAAIRELHKVIIAPGGIRFCTHCCLNKISERRFSCYGNHIHTMHEAPCPTLAIVEGTT